MDATKLATIQSAIYESNIADDAAKRAFYKLLDAVGETHNLDESECVELLSILPGGIVRFRVRDRLDWIRSH